MELPGEPQLLNRTQYFAPEQRPHHRHRQQKPGPHGLPGPVLSQSTATDQAM